MFIELTAFGETVFVNMNHVFDFHSDVVEGRTCGSLLHFTNRVEPNGHKPGTHHKKHVDQTPDEIMERLRVRP